MWSSLWAKNASTGGQWKDGGVRVWGEMRVIRKATSQDRDSSRNVTGHKKTINDQTFHLERRVKISLVILLKKKYFELNVYRFSISSQKSI